MISFFILFWYHFKWHHIKLLLQLTLQQFSIGVIWLRTSYCIRCTSSCIRFMHLCGRINSWTCTLFRRDQMRSNLLQFNARTLARTFYNVLCTYCTRKSDAHFCNDSKIIHSCLCVRCANRRLLLNLSHVNLQCLQDLPF